MRHTILIATLSSVAASVLTTIVIGGSLFGAGTANSATTPVEAEGALSPSSVESILQGDLNCDGVVDSHDTLGGLRFLGELDVPQTEPCPDIGTVIPAGEGVPGPQGPAGPQGEAGPPGISGYEVVTEEFFDKGQGALGLGFVVSCPEGKQALGGGGQLLSGLNIYINSSLPLDDGQKWHVFWVAEAGSDIVGKDFAVYAICANVAE